MANSTADVSATVRRVLILKMLSGYSRGYAAKEIRDRLELNYDISVTTRTIARDIDDLSVEFPISEEERDGKIYFVAEKFCLDKVDLTIEDMLAIVFIKRLIGNYSGTLIGKDAMELMDRLTVNTGKLNRKYMEDLLGEILPNNQGETKNCDVDPKVEAEVLEAMGNHIKLQIRYYSWNSDKETVRVIHPYALESLDGYLCVQAFCENRNEVRSFRISRIRESQLLNQQFEVNPEYRQVTGNRFRFLSGERDVNIKLLFDKETGRFVQEYQKQLADRLTDTPDGVLFEKCTTITDEVVRWVMQFGAGVRVLEPETLSSQIKEQVEALHRMYGE